MCISEAGTTIKKTEAAATAKKKASVWTDFLNKIPCIDYLEQGKEQKLINEHISH